MSAIRGKYSLKFWKYLFKKYYVLTCETPAGLNTWLMRLLASKGGCSWGAIVVGGAGVVIGTSDPNYKKYTFENILPYTTIVSTKVVFH